MHFLVMISKGELELASRPLKYPPPLQQIERAATSTCKCNGYN